MTQVKLKLLNKLNIHVFQFRSFIISYNYL